MIYPKAIYLIEGEQYEVQELHFREDEEKVAYVKRVSVDYFTDAISAKGIWLLERFDRTDRPEVEHARGEVLVAEKVVGFKKIKFQTMENVGSGEVELPQQEMQTSAYWITVSQTLLERISQSRDELVDGLRGVSYLLHQLAPVFLMCDVRDLGSWLGEETPVGEERRVRTVREIRQALLELPHFSPTIYLYDSHPGGIGLAEKLYTLYPELIQHARARLGECQCQLGCPSCVGPVNEVGRKAKAIARALLDRVKSEA
jgi:DEAD/DEAH box helicase domain-containing protein